MEGRLHGEKSQKSRRLLWGTRRALSHATEGRSGSECESQKKSGKEASWDRNALTEGVSQGAAMDGGRLRTDELRESREREGKKRR